MEPPVPVGGGRRATSSARSRVTHLSSKILQDGGAVDCRRGPDPAVAGGPVLQVPVYTADRELKPGRKKLACCQTCEQAAMIDATCLVSL